MSEWVSVFPPPFQTITQSHYSACVGLPSSTLLCLSYLSTQKLCALNISSASKWCTFPFQKYIHKAPNWKWTSCSITSNLIHNMGRQNWHPKRMRFKFLNSGSDFNHTLPLLLYQLMIYTGEYVVRILPLVFRPPHPNICRHAAHTYSSLMLKASTLLVLCQP